MKKSHMGNNEFNRRLLAALIVVTVAVCVFLAVILAAVSDKEEEPENNPLPSASEQEQTGQKQEEEQTQSDSDGQENGPEQSDEQSDEQSEKQSSDEQASDEQKPDEQQPVADAEDSSWMLVLANPWNRLPSDFTVELAEVGGGHKVDARIVDDLNAMMSDLASEGHSAFVCSSYRTNTKQTTLYNNEVADYLARGYSDEEAAIEAGKWVAVPGTSEHQTGLAVDIMSSYYLVLDEGQEDTAEQQWLMENSYKYGFVLRYPSDKSEITGIYYEPWHYRYVGVEAATEMYEKGICFEEYLGVIN